MRPAILIAQHAEAGLPKEADFRNLEKDYQIIWALNRSEVDKVAAENGGKIQAVVTTGGIGMSSAQMAAMPKLGFIQTKGMGYENVDIEAARARGIVVANSRNVNGFSVAEHAMALLLCLVREIKKDDAGIRAGQYRARREGAPRNLINGKTMGILGLGDIGMGVAKRAEAFGVTIVYRNRNRKSDVPYEYIDSVPELAARSDILVICCPGGPETRRLIGRAELKALGPSGYLINVGRGTVVDTAALVEALVGNKIAGAAVDVIDGEPDLSEAILSAPNLIITPHIAAGSPQSRVASLNYVAANLRAYFSGGEIRNRVA